MTITELKRRNGTLDSCQPYEDPIKSHDGMDVNCRTGVVESCGYEFKQAVAEGVQEAFQEDLEDEQLSLNERMQATIQMTGATQPITQSNSYSMQR